MINLIMKFKFFCCIVLSCLWSSAYALELPKLDAPLGILNEYECCYATCFLQAMNAVYRIVPDLFEAVLVDSPHRLLNGYAQTLNDICSGNQDRMKGFALQQHAFCPDSFMQAVVAASPSRMQSLVCEEEKLSDGTLRKTLVGPWKDAARGGSPSEVMELFLTQWNAACAERNVSNPFESVFVTAAGTRESRCWISFAEFNSISRINADGTRVIDVSQAQLRVIQYPQFLIVVNGEKTPFIPPASLPVAMKDGGDTTCTYRRLAIIYGFPVFPHIAARFVVSHGIAIVRYDSVWYLCNDANVTPFRNRAAVHKWIQKAGGISYTGPCYNGYNAIIPHIIVYERDGSHS